MTGFSPWYRALLNGRRRWLWALMALLLGLGYWTVWGRRPPPPPPKPQPAAAQPQMEKLSLTEMHEGAKRWVLEAGQADYATDKNEIRIRDIYLEFYDDSGRTIYLTCKEGLLNTKTRNLSLKDQVEVTEGDLRITTSLVHYLPKERLLNAPEEVVLENPRLKVQGKGLTVYLAEKKLVLLKHRLTEVKGERQAWSM